MAKPSLTRQRKQEEKKRHRERCSSRDEKIEQNLNVHEWTQDYAEWLHGRQQIIDDLFEEAWERYYQQEELRRERQRREDEEED
jgi:hypothetical protein